MTVTVINSYEEFTAIVKSGKPVVIDFWATWCGPCRAISPILDNLSILPKFEEVGFYKVDVDAQDEIAAEVGIKAMPTFILYKDGERVDDVVGAHPGNLQALVTQAQGLVPQ